jgi:poly-gamma-glutamate capsule biosynthesis protein CapA/YwtB (metallophosphatase superfamily)
MKGKHTFLKIFFAVVIVVATLAAVLHMNSLTAGDHKGAKAIIDSNRSGSSSQKTSSRKSTSDSEANNTDKSNADSDSKKTGPVSLIFTGDVNLNEPITSNYARSGLNGVLSPDLQELLKSADVLTINNEFSFSTRGQAMAGKEYTYRVDPEYVSILNEMGVDCGSIANNHTLDYGKEAFSDTITTLHNAGISTIGGGNSYSEAAAPFVFTKNGETFAIIAASRVIAAEDWNIDNSTPGMLTTYDPGELINEIKKAKSSYDHVLVEVHWGKEYQDRPEDYQVDFSHKYIDAGADAVIGMHPHVLQSIEFYNGKPIFYSLGNFMFFRNNTILAAVKLEISGETTTCQIIPAYATNSKTYLASAANSSESTAESVYNHLESISTGVGNSTGVNIDASGNVTPL